MTHQASVTCDACGNDLTTGRDGRSWRLMLMGEVVPPSSVAAMPRHDAHDRLPQHHFCDEDCLEKWAARAADTKSGDQARFEGQKIDDGEAVEIKYSDVGATPKGILDALTGRNKN